MQTIIKNFRSQKDKAAYVAECERAFETQLESICDGLCAGGRLRAIALSGPTCSGKTTTAAKLIGDLSALGADVHMISIDDFFREREALDREAEVAGGSAPDYDSIKAVDLGLFAECTDNLLSGRRTVLPRYDFGSGQRGEGETIVPGDNSVFIFEGIQAVYPEITALLPEDAKSVFISVADDIELNGVYFNRRDVRLMRRLVRDYKFRGAKPEFTFYIWRSVLTNEERSINPYESGADVRINSLMPYEIFVAAGELVPLLELVPTDSRYYPKALELEEKLGKFDPIPAGLIPNGSVLREFYG